MRSSDWSSDVCSSDLVRISRQTKMIVARTTLSIRASSRHHPGVHVDAHHRHVGVEHGTAAAGAALDRWTDPGVVEEAERSDARRVGNEWVGTCRHGWSPERSKNTTSNTAAERT